MSEWLGLHRNNLHTAKPGTTLCWECGECSEKYPCRCCLAFEVNALRARVQAVRELHRLTVDVVDGPGGPEDVEHCEECGHIYSDDAWVCPTIRILDGEGDE